MIGGKWRSRRLAAPLGMEVRPTSDRLREALFNVLAPRIEGARFLDLFAGTGAVGIEAISRGASGCVFVEMDKRAARVLRKNLESLGIASTELLERPVAKALKLLSGDFDLVFLDPPYAMRGEYEQTLQALSEAAWLAEGGIVIVEHDKRYVPGESFGRLRCYRRLVQGDAGLSFYRRD